MAIGDAITDTSHTNGILLGTWYWLKPAAKVVKHLVMILEPRAEAETMVAWGVDEQTALIAGITHSRVILHSIGYNRHQSIIACTDDTGRRCKVTAHSVLCRILPNQFGVLMSFLTQEVYARPLVRYTLVHRYYWIEQDREVWAHLIWWECWDNRWQMSACWETHNTNIVRIDIPHLCRIANGTESLLYIAYGNCTVAFWQSIVNHKICDTLFVQPIGCHIALVAVRKHRVSATRHTYDSSARRVLW